MLIELSDWAKGLGGLWAKGSFVVCVLLYVVGYLAIRFHLTAIGIGTDLSVLDERYLFTGARFLVYLVSCIPSLVLVALLFLLLAWALRRFVPSCVSAKILRSFRQPRRLLLVGIVFAVVMIQAVMRQCFLLENLLLDGTLSADSSWLFFWLLNDELMPLYFCLLVAGCALSLSVVWALRRVRFSHQLWSTAKILLLGLVAVQILLLPINYGVLVVDKVMPRVATLGGSPLAAGDRAWLVWEGRDGITFLVEGHPGHRRTLLTLPRSDVKRVEIVGFDHIVPVLLGRQVQS